MSEGPFGPATFWLEAIRHEMAALVGLVSEVASRDLTPVVHVESGGSDSAPALVSTPIDLQPLIDAIRNAPAPVVQAADLSPLLEKLDEIAHVSRGLGSVKGGGGPSFVTSQVRNEPGQTLHVTVDAQPPGSSGLTNTELRASPVPVSGTVTANTGLSQPATDAQLRATPLPVSGTVTANTGLSQPLTDTQLRATAVPVSGTVSTGLSQPLTDTQLRATAVPVSGPLTDTQLRATPVPVSGTVTANTGLSQPLTDTQLRASAVPVVATAMTDGTQVAQIRAATSYATVVSTAISLAATLTLPAAGAGLFHYITSIEITNYTGIARTGGATPITVTTTNLTGNPAYTFATAAAIGTTDRFIPIMCAPVKSAVANTATTFVAPVTTGSFWRINVTYYTAA